MRLYYFCTLLYGGIFNYFYFKILVIYCSPETSIELNPEDCDALR
jgi:hypothetical protein